jgi:phosphatidylserine/phosphatidylglycerophosphate/cardiolipin synthase-like enzyme
MKLIYQLPDIYGKNIKPSPFDVAISELVKGELIQVACPYITLDYFKEVILSGCKDWKLLTDVNALIGSQGKKSIEEMINFLEEFSTKIKHQDDLHAKAIIAEEQALLGSANFTQKGTSENKEISVIISDVEKVNEIKNWYNDLWQHATELTEDKLIELKKWVKENINNITEIERQKNSIPNIFSSKKTETIYEQKGTEDITKAINTQNNANGLNLSTYNKKKKRFNVAIYKLKKKKRLRYVKMLKKIN